MCQPFYTRVSELTAAAAQMSDYMELSVPVLTSLLAASGNVTSATVLHLFLYNATVYAGGLFSSFLLPLAGTYICLGIASAVTENEGLKTMTLGLRTFVNRCILILTVAFTGLLAADGHHRRGGFALPPRAENGGGFLSAGDGGVMSDSVDTLLSSLNIIKSVAGVFSIVVVFYLIVVPVLKMAVNFISLKLACFAGGYSGLRPGAVHAVHYRGRLQPAHRHRVRAYGDVYRVHCNSSESGWFRMTFFSEYVRVVIGAAVICGMVTLLVPKGHYEKAFRLITGVFLLFCMVTPVSRASAACGISTFP